MTTIITNNESNINLPRYYDVKEVGVMVGETIGYYYISPSPQRGRPPPAINACACHAQVMLLSLIVASSSSKSEEQSSCFSVR